MRSKEQIFRIEACLIGASLVLLVMMFSHSDFDFEGLGFIILLELARAANGFLVIYTLSEKRKNIFLTSVAIGIVLPLSLFRFGYNFHYCLLDIAFFLIWWLYSKGIQQSALRVFIVAALRSCLPLVVCVVALFVVALSDLFTEPLFYNLSYFCNSLACSLAFYYSNKSLIDSKLYELYDRRNNNRRKSTTKSKITALILSILLGGLGVDRFYLGYMGIGVLKLLTFGCFGILYIYDIVMIATNQLLPADGSSYEDMSKANNANNNIQDVASALEKLAKLHQQGILTDEEFNQKKADLLAKM